MKGEKTKEHLLKREQKRDTFASETRKLVLAILVVLLIYWTLATAADIFIFHKASLLEHIIPSGYDLWRRLLFISILMIFGAYATLLINKHRLTEKELKKVSLHNELILNSAGEGIYGLDLSGNVTFVNAAAVKISGYEAQELLGHNIHEILHYLKANGSPHPQEEDPVYAALRNGEARRVTDDVFWNKEGNPFPVEYVAAPIHEDGHLTGVVVVFRDISARKRAEQELQKAKDFLENVLENSADGISIVDEHGRFIKWNKAAEKVLGYSWEELKGKPAIDLYADRGELEKMMAHLRQDGFIRSYEINMKKKDGAIAPFSLSISYLHDAHQKILGSVCVVRDRSEIKKALAELKLVNEQLRGEIQEREGIEEALQKANEKLQGMLHEIEQRNRDITLINELGDLLQACLNREEAYAAVGQFAPQLFPDESGTLFALNPSKNLLEAVATWGESPTGDQIFTPDDCWAFRRGEIHKVMASQSSLLCKHLPAPATADHLCIPMVAQGEIMGLFHLQSAPCSFDSLPDAALECLTESKQHLAITLTKQISMALAGLSLRENLRWQAIRDPLTGLFNRRYMEESLEREVKRVTRRNTSLGVIMIDLDYFKHFNDNFGHTAGDAMLVALAGLVKRHIRAEDIACRYGGEELLIILPEAPLEITCNRAELLRKLISNLQIDHNGQPLGAITASFGVATFPRHGKDWEEIIAAADAAMYQAKQLGRNRVEIAPAIEEQKEERQASN